DFVFGSTLELAEQFRRAPLKSFSSGGDDLHGALRGRETERVVVAEILVDNGRRNEDVLPDVGQLNRVVDETPGQVHGPHLPETAVNIDDHQNGIDLGPYEEQDAAGG